MSIDIPIGTSREEQVTRVRSLAPLHRGDLVEARILDMVVHRGRVYETAPGIGALWITKEGTGERKLLHLEEFSIWLVLVG
ncbi:hypothetical protein [Arthrobacter sp. 35W]|uniref:hypothetical protein n=1 Tax=Arthrobacter sp. 35W TaxID=1132441 RepID=UPI0003FF9164|nr:hypothetical protein [Arthrobacter sp. 35W]